MTGPQAALWWLPVGAGGRVVIHTSRWWESLHAAKEHRAARPLFHAALEVTSASGRYVIEMTPAWGQPRQERGVVASGPVGLRWLGTWRLFRYEVRCWRSGEIPDRRFAPAPPELIALSADQARDLVARVAEVPRHPWGRDVHQIGDMWNSNSLIAWLLASSGVPADALVPPAGGAAPGWPSGIAAARVRH